MSTTSVSGQSYTVQPGDFLAAIAQRFYGDGSDASWQKIYEANRDVIGSDPTKIKVGMVLIIPGTDGGGSTGGSTGQSDFVQQTLDAHNQYRAEVGVAPLQWSDSLAASAQQWADHLAATGRFEHSGSGENLAKGSAGGFSVTQLVDMWGNEKQHFTPGTFPNVSNTGNWADVGHYTQVVWRSTTEVGCGLASGNGSDVLVCHYNPAGNFTGQNVF